MRISYSVLIPVLVKSDQVQQVILDAQEKTNQDQSIIISDLRSRIEQIEASIHSKSVEVKTITKAF